MENNMIGILHNNRTEKGMSISNLFPEGISKKPIIGVPFITKKEFVPDSYKIIKHMVLPHSDNCECFCKTCQNGKVFSEKTFEKIFEFDPDFTDLGCSVCQTVYRFENIARKSLKTGNGLDDLEKFF